ncbi:MAG TPA: diguanylate cyclase [Thiobacillaceae bacterium]|nr:diguanylate cyclase [Thiobacillaceae bacterium]
MPDGPERRRWILWPGDSPLVMEAGHSLTAHGQPPESLGTLTDLLVALRGGKVSALLADWDLLQRQPAEDRQALAAALGATPLVCLSRDDGLVSRLAAARYGSRGYLRLPLSRERLLAALECCLNGQAEEDGLVLIVDDSASSASFHARVLEQAGLRAQVITDPLRVLEGLRELPPDLILMDVYMPGASGDELVRVIRQEESFVHIPILYLSVESDPVRQRQAMALGGDEFLCKPIPPELLVSAVRTHLSRARSLRRRMTSDSLTGLLGRAHFNDRLGLELARARRTGRPLNLVLLDIDHRRRIRDMHGQAAFERVVRGLARQLRQRLRGTDLLGHRGEGSFAVAMPDTTREQALRVMNEVREVFSSLPQSDGERVFQCSFSAGLAESAAEADRDSLLEQAGQALREAKQGGRNRVVLGS